MEQTVCFITSNLGKVYGRGRWKPELLGYMCEELKQVRLMKNSYYRNSKEVDQIILRTECRKMESEIIKYRNRTWKEFVLNIQRNHEKFEPVFLKHLSKVHRH